MKIGDDVIVRGKIVEVIDTWDGRYFWITGTYADLYKVEVQ